jgi:hypothetical protein
MQSWPNATFLMTIRESDAPPGDESAATELLGGLDAAHLFLAWD